VSAAILGCRLEVCARYIALVSGGPWQTGASPIFGAGRGLPSAQVVAYPLGGTIIRCWNRVLTQKTIAKFENDSTD